MEQVVNRDVRAMKGEILDWWPTLPLVNKEKKKELGFLISGCGPRVFLGNVFAPPDDPDEISYDSFEKLAEEWRVD
ncbi:hypothetical protein LCGC14_1684980 [marine sediment metagenome]|uniref:Uncharacterized protein n=1 Tax=marine sediment metagenome TaxID=412755 RepID=A0A0F9HN14_9ZZZZ